MDSFLLSRVTMKNLSFIWMTMLLMPAACIQIPELAAPPATPPGSDAGTGPQEQEPIGIQWMSPVEGARVGSTARLQVQLTGSAPDRVELLVDGATVANLEAPFVLDWETQSISEGPHAFVIRALREEQEFLSAPRQLVVDRTKPRMVTRVPVNGAPEVSVLAPIEATFSEPLDPTTANGQSIQLMTETGRLEATVILSEDGTTLTLRPASPLPVNQQVRVVMAGTVVDLAGNQLDALSQDWAWSVPAYLQWGEPQFAGKLEESYVGETSLRVGMDALPIVAWTQNSSVHVKRWRGEGWEYLGGPLNGGANNSAWGNALQINSDGSPMVAWLEYATGLGQSQVHVRRWNGTAWASMGTYMTTSLTQSAIPWMGFTSRAQQLPVVAWHEENASQAQVVFRQWDGSNWVAKAAPLPIKKGANINYLGFDLDASERPIVSFTQYEAATGEVGRVMRWDGTSWTEISTGLGLLPVTRCFGSDGHLFVGGTAWVNGAWAGLVRKWSGSAWATVGEPLADIAGGTARRVDAMAMGSQGALIVLASEAPSATETASRIGQARRWTGTQWESLGGILKPNLGSLLWGLPDFALAGDDEPIVSWTEKVESADTFNWAVGVYRLNH
ncbi:MULTISPECIES: Ig-like domain-containing protein [unclassified Corallococcus]|uniref:Ig-like domain-containing protein n=1 Tax=unclassified Corallococcus TaxID=2685029 RepID=UPI001A8F7A07|nr:MULTISPECIES: Ig-like domain-containing protein [unclassified Corallococcus]MBN9680943.1 Ig-like domain-containing protein [Corallococcus sp. NCSPR001]WAS87459.1 Ig-like domain-containing protein [Corallococcus sp. NCRR]